MESQIASKEKVQRNVIGKGGIGKSNVSTKSGDHILTGQYHREWRKTKINKN